MSKVKKKQIFIRLMILIVIGILSFCFGFKKCNCERYYYVEDNAVDYKVYLKKNSYFEKPYLEKNKTYITSLIDYIDAEFKYKSLFEEEVTGDVEYQIIAEIIADKDGNDVGNYWTKQYELTKKKKVSIKEERELIINTQTKINYNKYNDILTGFIKEYGLQADSTLKIALVVKGKVQEESSGDDVDISSELILTVPLSKKAIEGRINIENNALKEVVETEDRFASLRNVVKGLFFVEVVIFIYYLFKYLQSTNGKNHFLNYREKIKKITNEFESIIVRVESANIDNYVRFDVTSVDDLLNIYNNVREPINYYYTKDKAMFFIINNTTCYVYTVIKEGNV